MRAVIISVSAFLFWTLIIVLKNWYQSAHKAEVSAAQNNEGIKVLSQRDTVFLPKVWKYHAGDDSLWARSNADDSHWKMIRPELNLDSLPENFFKGICWFRANIYVDSAYSNRILGIDFTQNGASQIFWDGKLIEEYGVVSDSLQTEEPYQPSFPMFFSTGAPGYHSMAIRYSNLHYLEYYHSVYDENSAGISLDIVTDPDVPIESDIMFKRLNFALTLLFGFFLTLCIVHFLLFLFYRDQKQNLYYSLFTFCFSICFLLPHIIVTTTDPWMRMFSNQGFMVAGVLFLLFLIMMLHSLFRPRASGVTFVIALSLAVLSILTHYFLINGIWDIVLSIYLTFACIEFIRAIIEGIRKKLPGSRIIGTGALIFAAFLSLLVIFAVITGNVSLSLQSEGLALLLLALVVFCIISLPLSMSIYLAYDFSQTNRNLSKKLTEVEELSAKTIYQEKEKQEILSKQKENLELQVTERTKEVVQQKKVIEEKNKDITDSINYAKRIQDAILPSEDQIKKMLPECFVLFKPKDIVSGDFYFFSEVQENPPLGDRGAVIAAALDCTGHGVPGAFMSMVGYNHLKRIVNEQGTTDTSKILDELHKQVLHSMNRDMTKRDSKDGMDVAIVSIDKQKREVQFSGAVRPLYYFVNGNFNEIKGERYSIAGVKEIGSAPYAATTIKVTEPTTFYLFSDGFADQFGGKEGKKLMSKNFRELLASVQDKTMEEQRKFLGNFIEEWKGNKEQMDDVMVIGIRL